MDLINTVFLQTGDEVMVIWRFSHRQSEIPPAHERSLSYLRTVRLTTVDDSADMVMTHGSTTARMTTTTRRG